MTLGNDDWKSKTDPASRITKMKDGTARLPEASQIVVQSRGRLPRRKLEPQHAPPCISPQPRPPFEKRSNSTGC